MADRDEILQRYRCYLDACNARDWAELGTYVADEILVNGLTRSRRQYVADIVAITTIFPDYRWRLLRATWDGAWLAVHLHDTGTRQAPFLHAPADGSSVETDEFALYRIIDGLIVEVEGTADNARLASTGSHESASP